MDDVENRVVALLIDADNISPKYLPIILKEAQNYGSVNIRRIYGDWSEKKEYWKNLLLRYSISPIQQYAYVAGKNASDVAMIIDAMDLLHSGIVSGFVIVSSDSDFTRLAIRLREAGKLVVGMGESKTPRAFVKSCEEFKTLDVLYNNTSPQDYGEIMDNVDGYEETAITSLSEIKDSMLSIVEEYCDEEGKMHLPAMAQLVRKQYPDFDFRNYGPYNKLKEFIKDKVDELEVSWDNVNHTIVYVSKRRGE